MDNYPKYRIKTEFNSCGNTTKHLPQFRKSFFHRWKNLNIDSDLTYEQETYVAEREHCEIWLKSNKEALAVIYQHKDEEKCNKHYQYVSV
jgi:hypothetical protein